MEFWDSGDSDHEAGYAQPLALSAQKASPIVVKAGLTTTISLVLEYESVQQPEVEDMLTVRQVVVPPTTPRIPSPRGDQVAAAVNPVPVEFKVQAGTGNANKTCTLMAGASRKMILVNGQIQQVSTPVATFNTDSSGTGTFSMPAQGLGNTFYQVRIPGAISGTFNFTNVVNVFVNQ